MRYLSKPFATGWFGELIRNIWFTYNFSYDMSYYLYATLFMLGGAYALSRAQHVRGDIFYRSWPVRVQGGVDFALMLLAFYPGILAMLSVMVAAIHVGFPTAFTLMSLGITFGYLGMGFLVFDLAVQRVFFVMQNDVLVAIPLFLFMGYIIERAGILDELFHAVNVMFGWLPGSLAVATLATGTIFATATGIVGASVTLLGLLAFPAMMRARYEKTFAAGAITASGTLGILIPPSVLLILYGFVAGVSVPRLYAGAFLPGFALSGLYLGYIIARAKLRPQDAPMMPKELRETLDAAKMFRLILRGFIPITALILFVMGAIFLGFATPSEGAALGALGGLLLAAL